MIEGIIFWIILCIVAGFIGQSRKIGFAKAFFISLLLSPLIGFIVTFNSKTTVSEKYEKKLLETQRKQQEALEKLQNNNIEISQKRSSFVKKNKGDLTKDTDLLTEELMMLREEGIITKDEFDEKLGAINKKGAEIRDKQIKKIILDKAKPLLDKISLLKQNGILTQKEFEKKKTEIFNRCKREVLNDIDSRIINSNYKTPYESEKFIIKKRKGLFGYVDPDDKIVIDFQFEDALQFNEGLACVQLNGKKGYINKEGNLVIPSIFDEATSFKNGIATVSKYGQIYMIDTNGNSKS